LEGPKSAAKVGVPTIWGWDEELSCPSDDGYSARIYHYEACAGV